MKKGKCRRASGKTMSSVTARKSAVLKYTNNNKGEKSRQMITSRDLLNQYVMTFLKISFLLRHAMISGPIPNGVCPLFISKKQRKAAGYPAAFSLVHDSSISFNLPSQRSTAPDRTKEANAPSQNLSARTAPVSSARTASASNPETSALPISIPHRRSFRFSTS